MHWFDTGIKASEINHDSNKAETYAKKLKLESIQNQTVIRKWDANGNLIQDGVINIVGFSGFYYSYFPSGNLNTKRKVISLLETPEYLWSATAYFDNAKGNTKSETIADTTMDGLLHFKSTTNFYTEQHKLEAVLRQHIPDDSNETIQHLTTYYENGSKEQESTAIEGKVFGTAKTWWPNGKIKTIESYKKSKLIGPYKEWNKHGNLMQSGIYTIEGGESKFTGKSTFYNEDNNRVQLQKLKGMTHGLVKITDSKSHPVSTLLVANDKILLKTDTTKIERKNKLHQHMFGFGFFADDSTFSINDSNINNVSLSSFRVTLSNGNKQKNYIEFENLNNDICNTKDQLPNSVKIDNQNIKVLSWCDHNSYSRTHTQLRITPSTAAGTKFLLNHLKKHSTITVTYNGITSELDIRGFNKVWNTAGGDAL
ncbi:toxin-antitoxin system YwqK family antitoxin [Vibrio sp. B1Z05]